ncbi:MAG: hypothetical protein KDC98_04370 [Planctomycetes bacterium]|nr:hypothetical protein [Planctomycetota bacterium]
MDALVIWWRENATTFVLGSLAWTGAVALVVNATRAPILRQRLTETAIAAWLLWMALGFVPRSRDAAAAIGSNAQPMVIANATPVTGDPIAVTDAWPGIVDLAGAALAAGALLAGGCLLVAALLLGHLLRRAVPAPAAVDELLRSLSTSPRRRNPVSIRVSDLAWRPFCCGLVRPCILLPRALISASGSERDARLRAVLRHELAHIDRGDLRGRLLFAFAMPLQFWNPLYWRLRRVAADAAELLADEVAAGRRTERAGYARSLIDLAEQLPASREGRVAALGVFGPQARFHARMTMLLQRRTPLSIRCSHLQTGLRSAAFAAFAVVAAACWTAPEAAPDGVATTPAAVAAAADESAPRVYFAFDDADVLKVIDTIAKIGGANIVVSPDVAGTVTLRVRDVPWRTALAVAVKQVGAHVVEEDRGILRVVPNIAASGLQVEARAVAIVNANPPQVMIDVKIEEGGEIVQAPQLVMQEGQQGNMFVGEADASGGQTGLVVAVDVAGGTATLDVARHEHGKVTATRRLTVPVER